MWKCKNCGAENGDSSINCASCGERNHAASAKASVSQMAPTSRLPTPDDRFSLEAHALESWGNTFWVASIFIAIIVFIASGISFEIGKWDNLEIAFHFTSLIKGVIPAACWIGGGYSFKLIVEALAIVVEAAYRNLMASGKSPN